MLVVLPERLGVLPIPGLALGLVGSWAAGERAVRGVVAGHVPGAVAARRRALELLRVRLQLRAVRARTPRQAAHEQTAYNGGEWRRDARGQTTIRYMLGCY